MDRRSILRHLRNAHGYTEQQINEYKLSRRMEGTSGSTFPCPQCALPFSSKSAVGIHMKVNK